MLWNGVCQKKFCDALKLLTQVPAIFGYLRNSWGVQNLADEFICDLFTYAVLNFDWWTDEVLGIHRFLNPTKWVPSIMLPTHSFRICELLEAVVFAKAWRSGNACQIMLLWRKVHNRPTNRPQVAAIRQVSTLEARCYRTQHGPAYYKLRDPHDGTSNNAVGLWLNTRKRVLVTWSGDRLSKCLGDAYHVIRIEEDGSDLWWSMKGSLGNPTIRLGSRVYK